MSCLLSVRLSLKIAHDSRGLFSSLSTLTNYGDKSIRADFLCICFEYEKEDEDEAIWIPGDINLPEPCTKTESSLTQTLFKTTSAGTKSMELSEVQSRRHDRSL